MRVVLADDHHIVREGLRLIIDSDPDIQIVGEARDVAELLALLEEVETDILLLDIRMPGLSGLDALENLRERHRTLKVIILTMYDDPSYVRRAVELGASAYLLKSVDREELLRAIHAVREGKSYIQGELSGPLIARMADPHAGHVGDLTLEEIQMLEMLADGVDNRRLAAQLGLSEAAVKARLRAVYSTLGVSRRSEAVAIALRLGLIT